LIPFFENFFEFALFMDTGNGEDSMSFLLDLISSDAGNVQQHQDEPMMDAASGAGHLQQHQSTALEDIEPSYDLFQFPTSVANDSNGTATSASILWQQLTMPQPQEPSLTSNTSNSAFQQYRSHSSCSSYSNFSSSVPSVASTPSLLSGFSTPAHPRNGQPARLSMAPPPPPPCAPTPQPPPPFRSILTSAGGATLT
ncbi:hypothetical protein BOX15_Mlig028484g2, partial [Macrostomum lignano]